MIDFPAGTNRPDDGRERERARVRGPIPLIAAACVVAASIAGCSGTGSSGSAYAIQNQDASATGCPSEVSVGDQVNMTVSVHNSTGHPWGGTYVFLQNGGFTRDSFTDDSGNDGQDVGGDQFRFPGLQPDGSTNIQAVFTADAAGNHTIEMQWWGSSVTSGIADLPDTTVDLSCAIAVNP